MMRPETTNQKYSKKNTIRGRLLAFLLAFVLVLAVGCGSGKDGSEGSTGASGTAGGFGSAETLLDINEIPEDGVITKEQFASIAGQDRQVQFTGQTEDGISYVWTYDASKIQNPEDQNLKISFTTEGLDEIKKQANNANDALMMTMNGKGVISVPTLQVSLPSAWESDTGLLLKEQGGNLAKMSDVTIAADKENGSTVLTMNVSTLDGDCYVVGGITGTQNKGSDGANDAAGSSGVSGGSSVSSSGNSSSSGSSSDTGSGDSSGGDVKNSESSATVHTCTISISCSTILNNMGDLTAGKEEFVPSNGQILAPSTIEFTEGESVHDVLKRVCKEAGIHMESTYTPMYDSAYVEGINQLYEFDCGELSGWMYNVNGWFPNYGCSKYKVEDGDVINWVYTCDLGKDVGDNSMY